MFQTITDGDAMKNNLIAGLFVLVSLPAFAEQSTINYPERAWHLDQDGYVSVIYDIDERGIPTNVRILESKPYGLFDKSVKEQIYKWRFEKGQPVKGVQKTIRFEKPKG